MFIVYKVEGVDFLTQLEIVGAVVLFVLIFLSSIFSAAETVFLNINKIKLKQIKDSSKRVTLFKGMISNKKNILRTMLFGKNVLNIYATVIVTSITITEFNNKLVPVTAFILTIVILIFSEIIPKALAIHNLEKVSLKLVYIIKFFTVVFYPMVFILEKISNFFIIIIGGNVNTLSFVTEQEIKDIIEVGQVEGALEENEKKMIYNVFEFGDTYVKEIMIPRTDIIAVDKDSSYDMVMELVLTEQFSRIPVYDENIDKIIGILNVKDFIFKKVNKDNFVLKDIMKEPAFTYKYNNLTDLFSEMRNKRAALAVVLNEYGGVEGIVSMEDIIEEIVGEIEDEYDEVEIKIEKVSDYEYLIDGNTKIEDLEEELKIDLTKFYEEGQVLSDTIGGLIMEIYGKIPKEKTSITLGDYKVKIEKAKKSKIEKIRLITKDA